MEQTGFDEEKKNWGRRCFIGCSTICKTGKPIGALLLLLVTAVVRIFYRNTAAG